VAKDNKSYTGGKLLKTLKTLSDNPKKPSVPGYVGGSGTPGYVRAAADAAERHASQRTGGAFTKPSADHNNRERVPAYGSQGKPDVKKDKGYHNPMKETK